jgi:hypothetical protein
LRFIAPPVANPLRIRESAANWPVAAPAPAYHNSVSEPPKLAARGGALRKIAAPQLAGDSKKTTN